MAREPTTGRKEEQRGAFLGKRKPRNPHGCGRRQPRSLQPRTRGGKVGKWRMSILERSILDVDGVMPPSRTKRQKPSAFNRQFPGDEPRSQVGKNRSDLTWRTRHAHSNAPGATELPSTNAKNRRLCWRGRVSAAILKRAVGRG